MLTTFLAISIIFFLSNQGVECHANELQGAIWRQGEGTLKEYLLDNAKQRNFTESRDFCESLQNDATLPMIKNKEEQNAVFRRISHLTPVMFICLGAENPSHVIGEQYGKKFLWSDGSGMERETDFTNWRDKDHPHYDHDGVVIYSLTGIWVNTFHRWKLAVTVCERPDKRKIEMQILKNLFKIQNDLLGQQIAKLSNNFDSKMKAIENRLEMKQNKVFRERRIK